MIKEINYKYFIENSNEAILFTSSDGKIIYSNPAACEMFGKTEEEICEAGRNGIADITDPRLQLAINERNKNGSVECELTLLRKDGTKFQGYLSSKVFIDENGEERTSMHIKDITKFKKTEDELNTSRVKYKNLFNRAQIGMFHSLFDGSEMLEVNDKICEMTGYKRDEIIGKSALSFWVNEEQRKRLVEILREEGKVNDFEVDLITKNGSIITILTSIVLYPEEGILEGSFKDITERKRMENALKEREAELIKINAEKDKFFSILAHDLRGPIGNFIGLTDLLKTDSHRYSIDELESIAERMNSSANNLFLLLTNLLDWSMVKRGVMTFNAVNINLRDMFESCYTRNEDIFENKKVVFDMNVPADLNVTADENMLKTVIRNLITNSVKFSNEKDKVSLSAKKLNDGTVEICVSDTGIGMDKEILDNLFKLDKNVQRKGTANEKSSGLGLILCKEFVELHKGKIWAESTEGKGSKFYFTINSHFDSGI